MNTLNFGKVAAVFAALGVCEAVNAYASIDLGTFTISGISPSDGKPVAASAHFVDLGSGQLQVTVASTSTTAPTFGIGDTIYGFYFAGVNVLTLGSAVAPIGSTVWNSDGTKDVVPRPSALTSTLDMMNGGNNWQKSILNGKTGASALGAGNQAYGLVSPAFNGDYTGDGLFNMNHNPYIQNSSVFTFNYTGSIDSISGVEFLYGTTLSQTFTLQGNLVAIPEPETMTKCAAVLSFGLFGLITVRRRLSLLG